MLWELLAADIEGIEGISAVGTVFEKIFVLTKKVQMKRSVTGGETKAAAHKGKALVLRWLGARQRLYLERRIRRNSASISSNSSPCFNIKFILFVKNQGLPNNEVSFFYRYSF